MSDLTYRCALCTPPAKQCADCKRRRSQCWKKQNKARVAKYNAEYHAENRDARITYFKARYRENPVKARETTARWASANPDKVAAYSRAYTKRNQLKLTAYRKQRYAEAAEVWRQQARDHRAKDPEAARAYQRAWYWANREHIRKLKNARAAANPLAARLAKSRRRALEAGAPGSHTPKDVQNLFIDQKGACAYCSCDLAVSDYHIDHVLPLCRGGSNGPENLALACPTCNLRKNAMTAEEFLLRLPVLQATPALVTKVSAAIIVPTSAPSGAQND